MLLRFTYFLIMDYANIFPLHIPSKPFFGRELTRIYHISLFSEKTGYSTWHINCGRTFFQFFYIYLGCMDFKWVSFNFFHIFHTIINCILVHWSTSFDIHSPSVNDFFQTFTRGAWNSNEVAQKNFVFREFLDHLQGSKLTLASSHFASEIHQTASAELYHTHFSATRSSALIIHDSHQNSV